VVRQVPHASAGRRCTGGTYGLCADVAVRTPNAEGGGCRRADSDSQGGRLPGVHRPRPPLPHQRQQPTPT